MSDDSSEVLDDLHRESAATEPSAEAWVDALRHVAAQYRLSISEHATRLALQWSSLEDEKQKIAEVAQSVGLLVKFSKGTKKALEHWRLPVIVELTNGQVGVVVSRSHDGMAGVVFSGDEGMETPITVAELVSEARLVAVARPERSVPDARVDAYIKPVEERWLRKTILRDMKPYAFVALASLIANLLALSGVIFSMQTYDRVIPAQSMPTLVVLFIGVMIAIVFDYLMKHARTNVVDVLGKRADLRVSDRVMGHALRVRNRFRPQSTGTYIAQIRDVEQIREMLTSTTVSAICDLPFFFVFLTFYAMLAGNLIFIPIVAMVLMLTPAILSQRKIRDMAKDAMRESSLRNAMLVETVQGLQDIKTLQAEDRFQQQWNHLNAVTGEAQLKQRDLASTLNGWTSTVQQGVFACTIFVGAPMVIGGSMTTGALVAASILGSRMMAPMGSVAQLLTRVQHARVAADSLNGLMSMPIDHPPKERRIHLPKVQGKFELKSAVFGYGTGEGASPVLTVDRLQIEPGEKIALLGRNGAGKSTLLQALSGMMEPMEGEVLVDNLTMAQVDPADIRRDIALLTQDSRLFHGTLRDNLLLGAPTAPEDALLNVLDMVGADYVRRNPQGLDYMILEGGAGLSGGQKQAILLARLLIRKPRILLLDEPTAAMDEGTERKFIERLANWSHGRSLIIATHRMRVLDLVDRIIVVDQGKIFLDGTKEHVLQRLRGVKPVTESAQEQGS